MMTASATGILASQQSVQPQPADYSLPGVMRYLQTEWQRNERDRIQWNLERAEMKTRIAKLEGDKRSLELVVDGHLKKIAILEAALEQQQRSGTVSHDTDINRSNNTNDNNNSNDNNSSASELFQKSHEAQAERDLKVKCMEAEIDLTPIIESRIYLEKCIQEVDYLLQSSHISNNGGSRNGNGDVDDEEEGEEDDDDAPRHQQQHNSHTVNSSHANTLSHGVQDGFSDADADRKQHLGDAFSTTSSTRTIAS